MRKSTAFLSILFISLVLLAQTQDDARFLEKSITYTLNPDGSWQKEVFHKVKLESYYATNRLLGETFILFNPRYQELTVLKSETTMKDGKIVHSPSNAFNPVLPGSAHRFPHFSHLREMVVTHTGLERGALITLHYLLKTKAGFMPYFSGREFVSDHLPLNRFVLKISVPPGKELHVKGFPGPARPELSKEPDRYVYTFAFNNLNACLQEPFDKNLNHQHILFSTAENWDTTFPVLEEKKTTLDPLLKQAIAIRTGTACDDEYYFKLQELIASNIDHCQIGAALNGLRLRSSQQIIDSNYGTSIEKAFLFLQLLQSLHIPTDLIGVPYDQYVAHEVPTIFQFKEFLLKIKNESGDVIFLSPTKKSEHLYPYSLQEGEYYNLTEKKISQFSQIPNHVHAINISGTLRMDKDLSKGNLQLSLKGLFNPYFSFLKDSRSSLTELLKNILPVSTLEIDKISRLTPHEVEVSVTVEGNFFTSLYNDRASLNKFSFPGITDSLIGLKTRHHALHLEGRLHFNVLLSLKMSEGLTITYSPPPVSIENNTGYYTQRVETQSSGDIILEMTLSLKKSVINPEQYPRFREVLTGYFLKQPLLVVKKI